MKVVILAGGFGTRISEESHLIPKPMIEIGEKPMLWHIMKYYSSFGYNDFIICAGYKQYVIKEFFSDYYLHMSDITFDFSNGNLMTIHSNKTEPWKVTIVDTGLNTMTGGRIKRIKEYIGDEPFMLTYGDGVSDIDISKLLDYHQKHGKAITMTSVQPEGRYGSLVVNDEKKVLSFQEKPKGDGAWINAGFFVCQPKIFDFIPEGEKVIFEREPLEGLAKAGELFTYNHEGFWKPMDTQRDKVQLEELIKQNKAPWIKW